MTPRNPIDDLFRHRLEHYEMEPSLHIWDSIDQERNWRRRLSMRIRRNRPLAVALLLVTGALGGFFLQPEAAVELRCFPVALGHAESSYVPVTAEKATSERSLRAESITPVPSAPQAKAEVTAVVPEAGVSPVRGSKEEIAAVPLSSEPIPGEPAFMPAAAGSASVILPQPVIAGFRREASSLRELECVRFSKTRDWKFYVDINAGPTYALRRFQARNGEFEEHADLRRKTESPQLSFSAGARFSVLTDFGLAIRSGLQYTRLNEKFDYTDNNEEKITITNIYGPNGEIIGTDTLIEKGMRRQVSANRYSLIDIPLVAGYEIRHKKWVVALNGGAMVNLVLQAKGNFLSPDGQRPNSFSSGPAGNGSVYRNTVGIGWYAGVGLHYQLENGLQLAIEPNLRYYPQSFTNESYGVRQNHTLASLSVGIRKQI